MPSSCQNNRQVQALMIKQNLRQDRSLNATTNATKTPSHTLILAWS
uniref:Uncharacterized protein n=1 Tax=Arundo donax TaxID=35708 RepID=A0A0A8ZXP2_ARUDO